MHRNARGKVDAVLLLDAARAQQHAGVADLLDVVFVNIAVGGGGQLIAVLCLLELVGVAQYADVAALRGKHLAALFKRGAVGNDALGQLTAGRHITLARQHQHVAGQLQADLSQVRGALALQNGHALGDLQRIADVVAERLVHIGDERRDLAAMRRADGDHLAGQLQRTVQVLHERAVAHRDIEQDRVRTGGQLLGHDGGRDQRDAADGGGHIAQGVHLLVGDGDLAALADDRNADLVDLPEKFFLRQARAGAGDSLHLVNRAARVAEAAPAHLGDLDTAGRHDGRNDQRRLVTDAAGGVLVGLDARDGRQIDHVAGVGHDVGQHGGLLVSHAAQVDGHEKRRHLVVGHIACHIAVDGEGQFFMVQRTAVALLGDNIVHSHSFSPCKRQAARLGYRAACCDL